MLVGCSGVENDGPLTRGMDGTAALPVVPGPCKTWQIRFGLAIWHTAQAQPPRLRQIGFVAPCTAQSVHQAG